MSDRTRGAACSFQNSTTLFVSVSVTNAPWTRTSRDEPGGRNSMSPLPEQMLRAHHVEHGARIDARGDAEADARREIRFDQDR